jgi:fibronectin-binding autotransporter adhesin
MKLSPPRSTPMKTTTPPPLGSRDRALLILTATITLLIPFASPSARAATATWTGAAGSPGNWTATNWTGGAGAGGIPAATDTLVFSGDTQTSTFNNFAAGTTFNALVFTNTGVAGQTSGFTLAGNSITLAGNITSIVPTPDTTITDVIDLDLVLGANSTMTIPLSGARAHNLTINGLISETGGARNVSKSGSGTLTLGDTDNSFTGQMQINQGTVVASRLANAGSASSLGAATGATSVIRIGNGNSVGTLIFTGLAASTTDRQIQIGSGGTSGGGSTIVNDSASAAHHLTFTAPTFNAQQSAGFAHTLTLSGSNTGDNEIQGTIQNNTGTVQTLNLVKREAGKWILSGSNTYTGTTTVLANGGTLQFGSAAALYGGNTNSWTAANIRVRSGGTLALDVGGTGFSAAEVTTLLGNLATSTSTNNGMNAGSALGFDTTGAGGSFTVTNVLADTTGSASAGARGLTKFGSGALILSANNSYTGPTTVSAGTLLVNGTNSGTGAVTVAGGATLGGSGTIAGATTISGIHSPGTSPGVQTFSTNLTYAGASPTVVWELTANTTTQGSPTPVFDQIIVGDNLNFSVPTTLTLSFNFTGSTVDWSNALWSTNITGTAGWLIYDVAGTLTNFNNISVAAANWADGQGDLFNTVRAGSSFSLHQDGNDIYLNYAVPEPSTYALLVLAAAGLGAHVIRRRRH